MSNITLTILSAEPITISNATATIGDSVAIEFAVKINIKYNNACNGCINTFTINSFNQEENTCAFPSPILSFLTHKLYHVR